MTAALVHILCSIVAAACRVLGRYRHVGEKKPFSVYCPACRNENPEGRYVDRYALLGDVSSDAGTSWLSRRLGVNIWLHRIWREDADRHPHDHPWASAGALVLTGGYGEDRVCTDNRGISLEGAGHAWHRTRWLTPGHVNLLPAGIYHRIVSVKPRTWTLFITGPAHGRGWGFLVDGRHVPSAEYLSPAGDYFRDPSKRLPSPPRIPTGTDPPKP